MASTSPPSAASPGPHPDPPADLEQRRLPLITTSGQQRWFRLHAVSRDALQFSRSGVGRFDAPGGEFGVLYAADDPHCAFIETFGRELGVRLVMLAELRLRSLARVTSHRPLRLVDLAGSGLAAIGADARLCSGDYAGSQRWSLALWRHPDQPDGVFWRSRFDPSRTCVAIYDRSEAVLSAETLGTLADPQQAALLKDILDTYGFGLG